LPHLLMTDRRSLLLGAAGALSAPWRPARGSAARAGDGEAEPIYGCGGIHAAAGASARTSQAAHSGYAEDLDTLAALHVFPSVAASLAASRERYSKSIGEARLMIGNAIRMMCRAPKSRAGCHFGAAIGLKSLLEDFAPTVPDWAFDQHTMKGKKLGRGLDHFRKEGAKLVPPPTADDPYEDEAYRLWQIKRGNK
jgi:hypothetical protein